MNRHDATPGCSPSPGKDVGRLRDLVDACGDRWEAKSADAVLRWAGQTFGDRLCATSSMADAVIVHMVARCAPGTDVLFLDTGAHFAETLEFRREVAGHYQVNVIDLRWDAETTGEAGAELRDEFARDPHSCCWRRKVAPLSRAMERYDAWITGIRRVEASSRDATPVISWDERNHVVKIAPIAAWTDERVAEYSRAHRLPENPLTSRGYSSIGCAPCTALPTGDDPRSGRWPGWTKTECGLHTSS